MSSKWGRCLWFATNSKHFSNFGCNLKILNVSAFGDRFSLVLHFSSNNLLIFFLRLILDSAITFGIASGGAYWVASLCNEFSIVILSLIFFFHISMLALQEIYCLYWWGTSSSLCYYWTCWLVVVVDHIACVVC